MYMKKTSTNKYFLKYCVLYVKNLQPVITFAGEHTHPNFYSTVHGAYLSGRAAAEMLLVCKREDEPLDGADTDLSSWIQSIPLV